MKYSLTNRQSPTYLEKADEILIQYRDRKALPDYAEKYPQAALVVDIHPTDAPIDFEEFKNYNILAQGRLTLAIPEIDPQTTAKLNELGIKYFWGYSISTGWELEAAIEAGVTQARVTAPLFFQTDVLKKNNSIEYRAVPNVAHEGHIPTLDYTVGTYIRPEDTNLYEGIFSTFEFRGLDKKAEQALYRIYAEQKAWPGPMSMIFLNFKNEVAANRMIPSHFTEVRLNCGQKCTGTSPCRLCYRYIALANPMLIKEYKDSISEQ